MNTTIERPVPQPEPFTPCITKIMVRQHAYEMFQDKLPQHPMTLEDWVQAEKDLLAMLEMEHAL
jgi:hypothetical protein